MRELSKSKFESNLERALVLGKDNESVERACLRTKYLLVDYERELASQPTPSERLAGLGDQLFGFLSAVLVSYLAQFG
jgi:hypothetical protein